MLSLVSQITTLIHRKQAASRWGLKFNRVATFAIPDQLIVNHQKIKLNLPKSQAGMLSEVIEIILDDCYHLSTWQKKLNSDVKILDIGGNVGLFSLVARQFFPEATIHSYEPNHTLESYLKYHANIGHFDYFMEAVGANDGYITLDLSEKGASPNSMSRIDQNGNIPMLSFEKAIEKLGGKIDLLKMDCEGAEWDILPASEAWQKVDNLELEYHLFSKKHTLKKIKKMIEELGFKITFCQPTNQYYGNLTATRF